MTRVLFDYKKSGIYYEISEHAQDHDACTICSTLTNVLVSECVRHGVNPEEYSAGHVRIYVPSADDKITEVFKAVEDTFREAARQHSEHIKIY